MIAMLLFLAGLGLLVAGAELIVRGAVRLAAMLGVTPIVIGLTIVSIGTSTPELAVGVAAAYQGTGDLAVGNIAGTNVLNLLFIMGLSALIRPLPLSSQIFRLELPTIALAALLMLTMAWDGRLSRLDGAIMLACGIAYTLFLIHAARRASNSIKAEFQEEYQPQASPQTAPAWRQQLWDVTMLFVGLALTVVGAEMLVRGSVDIASKLGVTPTIIGLTIVAFGTSAPELVTTIVSTIRNDRDVAVGNLLGSSIYNILFILAIPCLLAPGGLPVEKQLLTFDIPIMAVVVLCAIPVFITGKQVSRWEGGLAVLTYLIYLAWLIYSSWANAPPPA